MMDLDSTIPSGKYNAVIIETDLNYSLHGRVLNLTFRITEGRYKNSIVTDHIITRNKNKTAERIGLKQVKRLCAITDTKYPLIPKKNKDVKITVGIVQHYLDKHINVNKILFYNVKSDLKEKNATW